MTESDPRARIRELGLELPPAPEPGGVYRPVLVVDRFAYVSGHGPVQSDGTMGAGRVGDDMGLEEARLEARQVGLSILASLERHLGDLGRVRRLVKTLGMVNSTPDFLDHPKVMNGYSELMRDVFGPDDGVGVRSAVGMMLPGGIAVEIEAMFELRE